MPGPPLFGPFAVAVLTSGFVVRLAAKFTGTVKTMLWPAGIVAPVAPTLVPPLAPLTLPQAAVPFGVQVEIVSDPPAVRILEAAVQ